MGKNQSASNLTNIIKQDANGSIAFMSGSTMLMSLSNTGQMSGSTPAMSAVTASYADDFLVKGNLTAQTLVVQTITSSVDFVTGSTRFGSLAANTHVFTGSMSVSGSATFASTVVTNGQIQANSIFFKNAAGNTDIGYFGSVSNWTGGATDNNMAIGSYRPDIAFFTNNTTTPSMYISGSGNIGIGTTNPAYKLDVQGTGRFTDTLTGINAVFAQSNAASVNLNSTNAASYSAFFFSENGTPKSYLEYINSAYTDSTRRNYLEVFNNVGAVSIWTNATKALDIGTNQAATFASSIAATSATFTNNAAALTLSNASDVWLRIARGSAFSNIGIDSVGAFYNTNSNHKFYVESGTINALTISSTGAATFVSNITLPGNINYTSGDGGNWYINPPANGPTIRLKYHGGSTDRSGGLGWINNAGGRTEALTWADTTVTFNGYVTSPAQPAFRAYYSVNSTWALASNDTFVFNATEYNIGSCYNTSNGRFTAPVAGVYQFNFYTIVLGNYANGALSFRRNGGVLTSGFNIHFSPYYTSTSWSNVVYTTSLYLNAGDYVSMINGSGESINYHGDDWSSFSGYLVG